MRLIDADRLKELFQFTCTGGGILGEISQKIIEWACGFVDDMPTAEPRWISVTEGLPKPNEHEYGVQRYYLIQNEFGDMMVAAYRRYTSGETWWEQMYAYKPVEDEVIAWMPLPDPWKGEDDE